MVKIDQPDTSTSLESISGEREAVIEAETSHTKDSTSSARPRCVLLQRLEVHTKYRESSESQLDTIAIYHTVQQRAPVLMTRLQHGC